MCLWAGACNRSQLASECGTVLDCAPYHYCDRGLCRSDCSSSAGCPPGSACTPTGQCLRADQPLCEESDAPAPPEVVAAMPDAVALLADGFYTIEECAQFEPNNDAPGGPLIDACRRAERVAVFNRFLLDWPAEIAACRPVATDGGYALWHALPVFQVALNASMDARWQQSDVQIRLGHVQDTSNEPQPGTIWLTGTGTLGGGNTSYQVDGRVLGAVYSSVYGAGDQQNPGGPYQLHATRYADGGVVEVDERVDSDDETQFTSFRSRAVQQQGSLRLDYHDFDPDVPDMTLQVLPDLSGRLDDAFDGFERSFCWNEIELDADGGLDTPHHAAQVTYWEAAGFAHGNPATCLFPSARAQ
jgi:hypothetical protein